MNKTTRKWMTGAVLALVLCGMAIKVSRADDDDDDKALKAAIAAAKAAMEKDYSKTGTADMGKVVAKLIKDHKMEATMRLMKPMSKGGISIGKLKDANHKDCIELLLHDYATNKPPTAKEVKDCNDDLVKTAQVIRMIAEMTPAWNQGRKGAAMQKTPEKWIELTEVMKKGSDDLIAAAKAKDEKAVIEAARRLNNSCLECHKIFRDK